LWRGGLERRKFTPKFEKIIIPRYGKKVKGNMDRKQARRPWLTEHGCTVFAWEKVRDELEKFRK
jgi:hypothetical protein